jgi:ABC-2 type transport system permease protein
MRKVKNIYNLGIKELISLRYDAVLILLILYSFTVLIYLAATSGGLELRNASIAIVDEDKSPLSYRIYDAFLEPYFQKPKYLTISEIDTVMDSSSYTFVVDIPPDFQADLLSGRKPDIQVNIDATAMSQAGIGTLYINNIISEEIMEFMHRYRVELKQPVGIAMRVKFNPNLKSSWFMSIMEMINVITMLSMLLAGAAIVREREHGTIDHLLAMPLTPFEIICAKFWSNSMVIVFASLLSLLLLIEGILGVPLKGSIALFISGTVLYLFSTTSIGIFLATIARSMPQLGLLTIIVIFPMIALSGGYTPLDSMPEPIRRLMMLSPTTHFVSFAQAVLFRSAGLDVVWSDFVTEAAIGAIFFIGALLMFRRTITVTT